MEYHIALESYPRHTYSNMDRCHKHTVSDKSDAHINQFSKICWFCISKTILSKLECLLVNGVDIGIERGKIRNKTWKHICIKPGTQEYNKHNHVSRVWKKKKNPMPYSLIFHTNSPIIQNIGCKHIYTHPVITKPEPIIFKALTGKVYFCF